MAARFAPTLRVLPDAAPRREGGWTKMLLGGPVAPTQNRDRPVGFNYLNNVIGVAQASQDRTPAPTRILTATQIRLLYERTPDVRAAVDHIVRRVATWPWLVEPAKDVWPSHPLYAQCQEASAVARRFLTAPCINPLTAAWQPFMTSVLTDLLLYDMGAWENVKPRAPEVAGTQLVGLGAIRGSSLEPVVDGHGVVTHFVQRVDAKPLGSTDDPTFAPEDVVVLQLFPNTISPYGTPIIETLLNEVITLLLASNRAMKEFDSDEIPPGILFVAGLGMMSAKQFQAEVRNNANVPGRFHMLYGDDVQGQWVELRRKFKDVEFKEVLKEIQRIVWRVFGVQRVEMGDTENTPKAVGEVQERAGQSSLIEPILSMVEGAINARLLPRLIPAEVQGLVSFSFDREAKLKPAEQYQKGQGLVLRTEGGLLTINEARAEEGKPPIEGGDVPMVLQNGMWTPVALLGQQPEPPDEEEPEDEDDDDPPTDGGDAPDDDDNEDAAEDQAGEGDEVAPGDAERGALMRRGRYDDIDFSPPEGVQQECQRGVDWVEEGEGGDGLKDETVDWARRLARGEDITPAKARKMRAWLARHEVDKEGEGFDPDEDGYPSPGRVAWACWGGDPAVPWSERLVEQMDRADEEEAEKGRAGARSVEPLTREEIRSWLVEHYSDERKMPRPRIRALIKQWTAGHHADLLAPPPASWVYRGLQVRRATLAGLLGDAGTARAIRGTAGPLAARAIAATDGTRDKSWTTVASIAGDFAAGRFVDQFPDDDPEDVFAVVIVAPMERERFVLNAATAAREPGVADHYVERWGETLAGMIEAEQEVMTDEDQAPVAMVYTRRDRLEDLLPLLEKATERSRPPPPHRHGPDCANHRALPSDWPDADRFEGFRTLPLTKLADAVSAYDRAVQPLYDETARDVLSAFGAAYAPESLTPEQAGALTQRVSDALDRLATRWSQAVGPRYRDAALLARDTVRDWTADPTALEDWESRGTSYHQLAMGYLRASDGLIGTLRTRLQAILSRITRDAPAAPDTRARAATLLEPASPAEMVLEAVADAFTGQRHRIDNWSGKLVELANSVTNDGLRQSPGEEWWAEWVNVGDFSMCVTCAYEGSRGFRRLAEFTVMPGGGTECGGKCRCVTSIWTKEEVESGEAVLLGGGNTGEVL